MAKNYESHHLSKVCFLFFLILSDKIIKLTVKLVRSMSRWIYFLMLIPTLALFFSCEKEELVVVPNNNVNVDYQYIPHEKIEFYVNRLFIDLIGREPLDTEMTAEVTALKADTLSEDARVTLIRKLQYDTSWIPGDTSYLHAYSVNLYNLSKIKLLEGAGDRQFNQIIGNLKNQAYRDSLLGDIESYELALQEIERHQKVINSYRDFREGVIQYNGMLGRMLNNNIYDIINMNTFNFVNASFDNLLLRFPTNHEFQVAFEMCENDASGVIFGRTGANKKDYIEILTNSREMFQGMMVEVFRQTLARDPSVEEMGELLPKFIETGEVRSVQEFIMKTDEYANFD